MANRKFKRWFGGKRKRRQVTAIFEGRNYQSLKAIEADIFNSSFQYRNPINQYLYIRLFLN